MVRAAGRFYCACHTSVAHSMVLPPALGRWRKRMCGFPVVATNFATAGSDFGPLQRLQALNFDQCSAQKGLEG